MLSDLRQDIEANGWIHAEQWKEPVTKTFDGNFYDSLTEWDPGSIDAILLAEHLADHSKTYNLLLPELGEAGKSDPAVGDPRSRWQMMVKLVDLKLQQLDDFRRLARSAKRWERLAECGFTRSQVVFHHRQPRSGAGGGLVRGHQGARALKISA